MTKLSFSCKDVGMACDFHVEGEMTEEEIGEHIRLHARMRHNIQNPTPEMINIGYESNKRY